MQNKKGFTITQYIPYIIVVLVLIIIFVVLALLANKGDKVSSKKKAPSAGTIELQSNSGKTYVGGSTIEVDITGEGYGEIVCTSTNNNYAECKIEDNKLIIIPGNTHGTATITLLENQGNKSAKYVVTNMETELSLESNSGTITDKEITIDIQGKNYGELSCTSSNINVATCDIKGTSLIVKPASQSGEVVITLTESNSNKTVEYYVTHSVNEFYLSSNRGSSRVGGNNITVSINGKNYGKLSCSTSNSSIGTCSISGTTLTIKPGRTSGTATITVKESNAGRTLKYTYTNIDATLSLSETSGYTSLYGGSINVAIKGSNYGTLSCTTGNSNIATCSISGKTLIITPGKKTGTATITVKESLNNKSVTYKVTNEDASLSLSSTSGKTYVGNNITVKIEGKNYGELSCTSSNPSVSLCSISDNILTIIPKQLGTATITLKESNGNKTVKYSLTVATRTEIVGTTVLSLGNTSGLTTINGESLETMIYGSNYGTLSCKSSNEEIAICFIDNSKLIISPGNVAGNARITITESLNNTTVDYIVTVRNQ